MTNLIASEKDKSQQYYLKYDEKKNTVEISEENVAKVEAMIFHSEYGRDFSADNPKNARHLIQELKKLPKDTPASSPVYKDYILNIISHLDAENSTHLNADGVGRKQLAKRILDHDIEWLYNCLRNDSKEKKDYEDTREYLLIRELTKPTDPDDKSKYHPRKNFSFATKFCHYMCMYLFVGEEDQDNFSIYDKVVAQNLHLYLDCEKNEFIFDRTKDENYTVDFYKKYQDALDDLRKGKNISRNGLDHLLWWFHRSAPPSNDKTNRTV